MNEQNAEKEVWHIDGLRALRERGAVSGVYVGHEDIKKKRYTTYVYNVKTPENEILMFRGREASQCLSNIPPGTAVRIALEHNQQDATGARLLKFCFPTLVDEHEKVGPSHGTDL